MGKKGALTLTWSLLEATNSPLEDESHQLIKRHQRNHLQGSSQKLRLVSALQPQETRPWFHRPLLLSGTVVPPPPILAPHSSQCTEGCTCQESAYIEPKHAQVPVGCYGNYIMQQKLINTGTYRRLGLKALERQQEQNAFNICVMVTIKY